jgi:hypothetical protein
MTVQAANHRALPVDRYEDPTANEMRSRAEVERALRTVDDALAQLNRRIDALTARIEALETP